MATGRPQKGLNSNRNHHDSFGQSGQQRFSGSPGSLPKVTFSGFPTPKSSTPNVDTPRSLTNLSDSDSLNNKTPFKSL